MKVTTNDEHEVKRVELLPMPLSRMYIHQHESIYDRQSLQSDTQGNEERHEDTGMVLGHIAHNDQSKPEDDDSGNTWPRTVLGVQDGGM
jgi:hypothetical protein